MAATELGEGDVDEAIGNAQEELRIQNALTTNALTTNALTTNALTTNALTTNALTTNALTTNALTLEALHDPAARELLKFVIGCALPADERVILNIDRVEYRFDGELGLAPQWGRPRGTCNETCQEWVSACVLSRVNYLGEHIPISVRGAHPVLEATCTEESAYPHREAAYYGNIFTVPQSRYACLPGGVTSIPRVCGPSLDDCVMDVVGTCRDACLTPALDGSYRMCADEVRNRFGNFPPGAETYRTITVFLQ